MWLEIFVGIALLIFAVTAYFLIRTLITMEKTLRKLDALSSESVSLVRNTDRMLTAFDPVLHSLSNIGEIVEDKTTDLRARYYAERERDYLERKRERIPTPPRSDTPKEIVEWALLSAQLFNKFANRR